MYIIVDIFYNIIQCKMLRMMTQTRSKIGLENWDIPELNGTLQGENESRTTIPKGKSQGKV